MDWHLSSLECQVALGVRNGGLGRNDDGVTACKGKGACERGRMSCACAAYRANVLHMCRPLWQSNRAPHLQTTRMLPQQCRQWCTTHTGTLTALYNGLCASICTCMCVVSCLDRCGIYTCVCEVLCLGCCDIHTCVCVVVCLGRCGVYTCACCGIYTCAQVETPSGRLAVHTRRRYCLRACAWS